MKRSKEELTRIHKEKCRELKEIRAKMAENLGLELHQRECTYEGYCSGTCPACRKEELQLNAALLKKQMEEANLKGRIAAAGLTAAAALCLTGCNTPVQQTEGDMDIGADNPNNCTSESFSLENIDGYMVPPEEETTENDNPVLPEADTSPQDIQPEEGQIMPETWEDPAQQSLEIPGEYVELEGDIAYVPLTDSIEDSTSYNPEAEEVSATD